MARVVKFPVSPPEKLGPEKARKKRRKPDLEDFGQLNLFEQAEARVVDMPVAASFFEEALRLDERGEPDAEKYYLLAIKNGESVQDAYCNLGILKTEQGDKAKAVDFLTRCLKEDPRHFEAHYNLANVYSDLGNFALSRLHYEVSIEIEPEFPNSYYNLGLVLISMKEYKKAMDIIDRYILLSPETDHEVVFELIRTLKTLA